MDKLSQVSHMNIFKKKKFPSSRNPQELESVIKLLISDYAVRKKFPGTTFLFFSFVVMVINRFRLEIY
jgi:hypothetical protein